MSTDLTVGEKRGLTLLDVIMATVTNPDVDVNKLRVVMEMQERAEERDAEKQFALAFADMQKKLPRLVKDGIIKNEKFSIPFATFEAVMKLVEPKLREYGFSASFTSDDAAAAGVLMSLTIRHTAGHSKTSTMRLPADTGGAKNAIQGIGSARSYAKRYLMLDFLNIVTVNEDDDAIGTAPGKAPITREQADELADLIIRHQIGKQQFLNWAKIKGLSDLPAHRFDEAKSLILARNK